MTQEQGHRRRPTRADRKRPVLVTSSSESETTLDEPEFEQIETVEESVEETAPTPAKTRRLPGFFSTIGKKSTEEAPEVDVAQARLARATRKAGVGSGSAKATEISTTPTKQEKQEAKPKPAPARTTATRPGGFKTRYLLGMVIYLLGANFIGVFETEFMTANHLNYQLTSFNLFGGQVIISTSTLVFLATLILLLIVLAKFDLIPRSLGALAGQPEPARRGSGQSNNKSKSASQEPVAKTPPPTMRQGVKGADDDLYEDYRATQRYMQRRARKRS
jgi:hypothetical protein